ncbi:MAG: RusA family crossover junction endodeoxyribonuclease [bacterium]|nr:RusA family crossover junction endodeoxyribonuclease [bacterium]
MFDQGRSSVATDGHISIRVPGKPMGKQRHRMTKTGHTYTPKETVEYEKRVASLFVGAKNRPGLPFFPDSPVCLNLRAYFPIPKSWSKKKQERARSGEIRPTTKPDIDNITKIVCDALNGVAFEDDSQVVTGTRDKWYSDDPRVEIEIYEVKK